VRSSEIFENQQIAIGNWQLAKQTGIFQAQRSQSNAKALNPTPIDPTIAETHANLGWIGMNGEGDTPLDRLIR